MQSKRVGFISTRLAGTDGVSLETEKWADVLAADGHECYYMAGELDTPEERSFLVPECHFTHPEITNTYDGCFGHQGRTRSTTKKIERLKDRLKDRIVDYVERFDLDLLIPENALTIPLNLPLGLAITEMVVETGTPAIAHHHDFFWERKRFLYNGCWDYLNKAFPPHVPQVHHAVINSSQDNQLSLRTGISAEVIPNVMDFANPPAPPDDYAADVREALGIGAEEKLILQPTRIVKRKGIEHAVELVSRLGIPAKLVITHASGDEGDEYATRVRDYSLRMGVETVFCAERVDEERGETSDGRKVYELRDVYPHADLVTYPSTLEGFGNAFLEALYHKRPVMVNNYSIYHSDIKPKGFWTVEMDDYVSAETVRLALDVLRRPELGREMAEHNYDLARRYFSYEVLRQKTRTMMVDCFGATG